MKYLPITTSRTAVPVCLYLSVDRDRQVGCQTGGTPVLPVKGEVPWWQD
ncbi:MAG: hypothetical protein WA240_08965 [Nitrospirota bacterium]